MPALAIVSLAIQGYSMVQKDQAAKQAASLATSVARRNANIDLEAAKQLDLDTAENIRAARQEAAVYTSRQNTSYAASGVLSDSGSPLAVQAQTMGRLEQRIQQEKTNAARRSLQMQDAAYAGIKYGEAKAKAIGLENTAEMLKGGANMLSTAYGAFGGGAGSGGGDGGGADWSSFDKMDFVGGTEGTGFNY